MQTHVDTRDVMEALAADLARWNQGTFAFTDECGTTYCMAGKTMVMAGYQWVPLGAGVNGYFRRPDGTHVHEPAEEAADILGYTDEQVERIFYFIPDRSVHEGSSPERAWNRMCRQVTEYTDADCMDLRVPEPGLASE